MARKVLVEQREQLIEHISALTGVVLADETIESVLTRVATTVTDTVAECSDVSVSLAGPESVFTAASGGAIAQQLDDIQYETGEGPCLATIDTGKPVRVDDITEDDRWPRFAPRAAEQGLRASFSLPLPVQGQVVGSLNLYSTTRPFDVEAERLGHLFAAQATAAMANIKTLHEARSMVDQLTQALESRDVIGQAKGILMAREGCTADQAFDILRRASQRTNMKLRDVAVQVVASVGDRSKGGPA